VFSRIYSANVSCICAVELTTPTHTVLITAIFQVNLDYPVTTWFSISGHPYPEHLYRTDWNTSSLLFEVGR